MFSGTEIGGDSEICTTVPPWARCLPATWPWRYWLDLECLFATVQQIRLNKYIGQAAELSLLPNPRESPRRSAVGLCATRRLPARPPLTKTPYASLWARL